MGGKPLKFTVKNTLKSQVGRIWIMIVVIRSKNVRKLMSLAASPPPRGPVYEPPKVVVSLN